MNSQKPTNPNHQKILRKKKTNFMNTVISLLTIFSLVLPSSIILEIKLPKTIIRIELHT